MLPLALVLAAVAGASPSREPEPGLSFPPEWAPQQAMWIGFNDQTGAPVPDYAARIDIIEALHPRVPVKVLVDSERAAGILDRLLAETDVDRSRLTIIEHPIPNGPVRDAGPIFVTDGSELTVADFRWNCYADAAFCGEMDYRRGEVANDLAERFGWAVERSDFVAEGGGLEASSSVILAYADFARSRNPDASLDEIGDAFLQMYGKQKMVWIEKSPLIERNGHKIDDFYGPGANGHIDAFMRFVNDDTILVAVMDEADRDNSSLQAHDYEVLQAGMEQIRAATDSDGRPFDIVEIPVPDVSLYIHELAVDERFDSFFTEHSVGDRVQFVPSMSYANFLITNDAVLVSQYWREGLPESERRKDERMKEILSKHFPDREIIGIPTALLLNFNGGGIHCQTQQEPRLEG